jgi:hypothetical protein
MAVAVLGVAGTLAASLLTQAKAARLEERRWTRERARDESRYEREQTYEHERWLRDKRHEVYAELIRASSRFFVSMSGTGGAKLADLCEDEGSRVYEPRHYFFAQLYQADFLAGPALQAVIRRALDNTENAGHEPYFDDPPRQRAFEMEVFHEAYAVTRALEETTRAELRLPPPLPREPIGR